MCYIVPTKKRKDQIESKYNKIYPINLAEIPECDRELALSEFSEGLEELRLCLKVLWDNNLETKACCAGNHNDESHAYIAMAERVDIFRYLSSEILNDENIKLEFTNGMQIIRFYGDLEHTKTAMLNLTECILTGIKDNGQEVRRRLITKSINKKIYTKKLSVQSN